MNRLHRNLKKNNRFIVNNTNQINKSQKLQEQQFLKPIEVKTFRYQSLGNNCIDTSVRLVYTRDSSLLYNGYITQTQDGNIIIPGILTTKQQNQPHILKCTPNGDTLWSRLINCGFKYSTVYRVFELKDNDLIVFGEMDIPMPTNGTSELMILKLSSTGEFKWAKTFKSFLWNIDTTTGGFDIYDFKEGINNEIYVCGDIRHSGPARYSLVFKMDAVGNVIWSRAFTGGESPIAVGLDYSGSVLKVFGRLIYQNSFSASFFNLNALTGDTINTKFWYSPGSSFASVNANQLTKLNNGNYVLTGKTYGDILGSYLTGQIPHVAKIEFDSTGTFLNSSVFQSSLVSNGYNSVINIFNDGSGVYSMIRYVSSYSSDVIVGSFNTTGIIKERVIPYRGNSTVWISNFLKVNQGNYVTTQTIGDSATIWNAGIELLRLSDTDTAGSCLGSDTLITQIVKQQYLPHSVYYNISKNVLTETFRPFYGTTRNVLKILSNCKLTSFCNKLKLSISSDTICTNSPLLLSIHKNKECGAWAQLNTDTSTVSSIERINDTTLSIIFKNKFTGFISANISTCNLLTDSVHVVVLPSKSSLNLGKDTSICSSNTIQINAGSGYASYLWQDGSTDSVFIVTSPGKYFVNTRDACNQHFSDTIIVSEAASISINIGPDLRKCNNDSLTITAPSGFLNYQWMPNYNINTIAGNKVVVFPTTDTMYKVMAEKTKGCFAFDSIYITVNHSPLINLGNDTTICSADSLILNVGNGFSNHLWNTGITSKSLVINKKGTYFIVAVDSNSCKSKDSINVYVNQTPSFSLGNDTTLCNKQTLILQSNVLGKYLWQDGSTVNHLTVKSPGVFWLQVIDNNCLFRDSISINYIHLPLLQLPDDTILCNNSTILLNATQFGNNANYIWQDASTKPTYLVTTAGTYIVKVIQNGCTNLDTSIIHYQQTPKTNFAADTTKCKNEYIIIDATFPNANYLWQDLNTTPTYTVTSAGQYFCTITNSCGQITDTFKVKDILCECQPIVPNAFSPNGDGFNDEFKPMVSCTPSNYSILIFDRNGQVIFESFDISNNWKGFYNNKPVPIGTYWYVLKIKGVSDPLTKQISGSITLLR